ncbi:MAG: UDP-glucose/GDP-mannose dehydrogenase family protein [Deltaproteobacteria bacterium]|nr:UDP-glucose/GDP-mannose dehydrogenase family protein [Deltaproteobacteria bacterium]
MRIGVLGTGYVGLVAGACFSDSGNHVTCGDVDREKISRLQKGIIPIFEPGLEEIVVRNLKAKRLVFTSELSDVISKAQVIIIAVGTPPAEDGSSDLRYLLGAVQNIRSYLTGDAVVVIKSTVPVGTADKVVQQLKGIRHKVSVVSNPEFLKEGTAVNDFLRPERVILGCEDERARQTVADLYAPYVRSGNPILYMSNRSAELSKYAANTFLAMKISYINELATICERVGANIHDVRKGLITDSRIGHKFLYPGCGYGGSCFPKDVQALIQLGKEYDLGLDMFSAVHSVNERQKRVIFEKISRHFHGELKGRTIAIWGLSFKPMTDDMREAPSVTLIDQLLAHQCKVRAYDPVATGEARRLFENKIELYEDGYEAIDHADALAIMTEWNEFRNPDFELLKKGLKSAVVFDGRDLYSPESMVRNGFTYYCIGKPDPK